MTNTCSDLYTQLPTQNLMTEVGKYDKIIEYLRPIAIATVVVIAVNIIIMILVCALAVDLGKEGIVDSDDEQEEDIEEKLVPVRQSEQFKNKKQSISGVDDVKAYMA